MTTPAPENSNEIPRDVLQEILLTLPTEDVARSSCVSRLWRDIVRDPSFRELHGNASHVVSGAAETLLVSEKRKHGCNDEAGVFNMSLGKALCRLPIVGGYVLANVCNGFLCFVHGSETSRISLEAPALVCNPATGEAARLPGAPRLFNLTHKKSHVFALGFSPPTNEYKLFRLTCDHHYGGVEMDVYTLGDSAGGWRTLWYPCRARCHPTAGIWAPVSIDGKLYVATHPWSWSSGSGCRIFAKSILVIDVCTETCHTYNLPCYDIGSPHVSAFELSGRLCFAAHTSSNRVCFWVMSSSSPTRVENHTYNVNWDLYYSFHVEGCHSSGSPCGGWLGGNEMLYYMEGFTLHKYDMRGPRSLTDNETDILQWEQQVDQPATPLLPGCRCPNICGGYRPTLLSPLALEPQEDVSNENVYQLEHAMLSTLKLIDRTN